MAAPKTMPSTMPTVTAFSVNSAMSSLPDNSSSGCELTVAAATDTITDHPHVWQQAPVFRTVATQWTHQQVGQDPLITRRGKETTYRDFRLSEY